MAEDSLATGTFFSNTLASGQTKDEEETDLDHIEPRQATLFLVDTTPPMFEEDPNTGESPFMNAILAYQRNMQMMCGFNRDDWISLMLFGTNEWDKDPETKNVLTVQKFHKISLDMLKEIREKIENHKGIFDKLSSETAYPLHDALWHASQAFSGVKTVIIARKVVLFTCQDNPFENDPDERHRIRTRISTFQNLKLELRVMGLKNDFNHDLFYKDLEILCNKIDVQSYKKLQFDDLEEEIQFPSRTISNITWRFGKGVEVPVSMFSLSTETKYPESIYIHKTTNEPLTSFMVYKKESGEIDEDEDEEEPEGEFNSKIVSAGGIAKYQVHGDKKIVLDVKEISTLFDQFEKGIETLCFKRFECDPMNNVQPPKFLCVNEKEASESQKQFFATMVAECESQELMAVCRITYRLHVAPSIFYFYPNVKRGGFFVYKMAYEDHIRNLDDTLSKWIWKNERQDRDAVEIFEKIVGKVTLKKFDPSLFKNPKLGNLIANIEALALDLDERYLPPDQTLPSSRIQKILEKFKPEYNRIFGDDEEEVSAPAKRVKLVDDNEMKTFVMSRQVDNCTVPQLREFLKRHHLPADGRKSDLVTKVYQAFQNT